MQYRQRSGRDVSIDEVEAQLESSRRRMLAILPQGTAKADFGTFDTGAYVKAVFGKLTGRGQASRRRERSR